MVSSAELSKAAWAGPVARHRPDRGRRLYYESTYGDPIELPAVTVEMLTHFLRAERQREVAVRQAHGGERGGDGFRPTVQTTTPDRSRRA